MAHNICASCESQSLIKSWMPELVPVTLGDECSVVIEPTVPVWTCEACGEAFTDCEADDIRDRAVKAVQVAYMVGRGQANGWLPNKDQGLPTA